jgi:molybdopterin-guanine dinucleotide biosynthesis protein A
MRDYAAIVLAGGAGRRLGGAAKPSIAVAGRPMLARVLAAVDGASVRVVVGPAELAARVPAAVRVLCEDPPGGGPVAARAAGLSAGSAVDGLPAAGSAVAGAEVVAVLAADLPFLSASAVGRLRSVLAVGDAVAVGAAVDGAVFVDGTGRRQWLCGVWRPAALRDRLLALAETGPLAGRSLRELFTPLRVAEVSAPADGPPPWYDCDTPAELAEAERIGRQT